jgi:hypothetical protein
MTDDLDLAALARGSPFIFGGEVLHDAAITTTARGGNVPAALVAVNEVIRVPPGLTGFEGSQVTVHLIQALEAGRYIFFAEPWSVGGGLTVRELGHLDASRATVKRVTAAVLESHRDLLEQRLEAATLVVLGTLGPVKSLVPGAGRPKGVPWAEAPLDVDRVIKGSAKLRRVVVVGPRYGSRHLPGAPALRPGLHALFFLTAPPHESLERLSPAERDAAFFIATSADIQPPEQLAAIEGILGDKRKK